VTIVLLLLLLQWNVYGVALIGKGDGIRKGKRITRQEIRGYERYTNKVNKQTNSVALSP
jgi:hypothetical protein